MRFRIMALAGAVLVASSLLFAQTAPAPTYEQLMRQAYAAHEAKDFPQMLAAFQKADALRPNHPTILVNLIDSYALNGQPDQALAVMARLVAMKVTFDTSDTDLDPIRANPRFVELDRAMQKIRTERIAGADVAFRIPEKGLITEGLAWDAARKRFLVSSARKGKIIQISSDGSVRDFVSAGTGGVHGLSGMGIDAKRNLLWACSSASPRQESFQKGDPTDASLVAFDLDKGTVVRQLRSGQEKFFCDDLTVAKNGTVFVSDSTGSILRGKSGASELSELVPHGIIRSPQGSALSGDEKTLYVADYGGPIRAVDVRSGSVKPLRLPADFQSMGIDGLTREGRSLIAVQNGVSPNRIVRLDLSADGSAITAWHILEMNHPLIDEPTIGEVVGGKYYFVGASQGHLFDEPGSDMTRLTEGLIFSIPLK